jgi:hypothetical protein
MNFFLYIGCNVTQKIGMQNKLLTSSNFHCFNPTSHPVTPVCCQVQHTSSCACYSNSAVWYTNLIVCASAEHSCLHILGESSQTHSLSTTSSCLWPSHSGLSTSSKCTFIFIKDSADAQSSIYMHIHSHLC